MNLVVKVGTVKLPGSGPRRVLVRLGQLVPEGALPPADVERLISAGILGPAEAPPPPGVEPLPGPVGRWRHDPASLAGRSRDELLVMALDGDPEMDVSGLSEAALVQLLTGDYEPALAPPSARSRDRNRLSKGALRAARRGAARVASSKDLQAPEG